MNPGRLFFTGLVVLVGLVATSIFLPAEDSATLGIFSGQADVGSTGQPGLLDYRPSTGQYIVVGGGDNIWFTNDNFHFVFTKMSGDVAITANVKFLDTIGNPHRKACLFIRQTLAPDSAYADVAVHASGLTSLQYREGPHDQTHEIRSEISAPMLVRLEKRGDYFSFWVAADGQPLKLDGGYLKVPMNGEFYVGLGVSAHDNNALARAAFSQVKIETLPQPGGAPRLENSLENVNIASTDRTVIFHTTNHIEAPNWSRDGTCFFYNSGGKIYKLPLTNAVPQLIDTGDASNCNNDHGLSPDGTMLAVSADAHADNHSRVYVLPLAGGPARLITPTGPSYWHGWSPDGKTLAFCGQRNGEFDVYTVLAKGGEEIRLTTTPGLDDGPDYSPDGKFIYFNSERTGQMQIWRMNPDGSGQEQMTSDDYNNWFAHPSPDGKWIAFLTYDKSVKGHPANQDVMLRLMNLATGKVSVLAKLFGGQGTMNVPSWSPDSTQIAFVSYQLVQPASR